MPMINSHLVPEVSAHLPRQALMISTYVAIKIRLRKALIEDWSRLFPPPAYSLHPPALNPLLFMGMGKFVAAGIHQMRAGKSYLPAHPSWWAPKADTSCPHWGLEPKSFEHAIRTCPSKQGGHARLLRSVPDVGHVAPLWSSLPLLKRLATYISVTSTGFPSTMFSPLLPPLPRPSPCLPSTRHHLRFMYFPWPRLRM